MELKDIIGESWIPILENELKAEYMQKLSAWLREKRLPTSTKVVYPASEDVFKALRLCPFDKVKVVILGQDPYPDGTADGLAFSYKGGVKPQGMKSLDVILNEMENDCYDGFNPTRDYDLSYLAEQGVLLLNTVLTVFRNTAGSHKGIGWEQLTNRIINALIQTDEAKVFMLWGRDAQGSLYQAGNNVRTHTDKLHKHLILNTYHPASDLYNRDTFGNVITRHPKGFTGCKHFSITNSFLLSNNISAIDWFPVESNKHIPILSDTPPF